MKKLSFKKCFLLILAASFLVFKLTDDRPVSGVQAETPDAEQAKPELVMQTGHSTAISAVVFSPDGKWIASGDFDNNIKIWEAATGRELRALMGHNGAIKSLAWSSDGKWLVSGSNDKTVKLWNVTDGQVIRSFGGFSEAVEAVAFSQNGQMIASGSADQSIKIRETESENELKTLSDVGGRVTTLVFSPDGQFIAAGISDNTIKIWEIGKDKKPRVLKKHTDRIKTIVFSPDGKLLASGAFDNTVRIWNAANGREDHKFTGHTERVLGLQFLSNTEIVSADAKRNIKFWNPANGSETRKTVKETGADEFTGAESAAFSPDSLMTAFGYGDRTAALFDAASGRQISRMENHISGHKSAAFSPDKKWLAVASADNTIKIWDLEDGQSLPPLAGHSGFVRSLAFTRDSKKIISASIDGTIKIWNFMLGGAPQTLGKPDDPAINSISVSSDGEWLVSGGVDKTVKIWDLKTAKEPQVLTRHGGEIHSVAISPDENLIASGSVDKTVKVWNRTLQKEVQTFTDHTDSVESVAFSRDGKLLASASADKTIKIRDAASWQVLSTFSGQTEKITSVSFSPDSKWIAAGDDKTVRLRRVSGEPMEKVFEGHSGTVNSVNFDPDGKWLVSASDDGSVNIWQTNAASKLVTLLSLRANNDWLVVSPKGFFDGSATAWNKLLWRFSRNTFNFSPVEIFYNEFYQPGLLAKLLKGEQLDATGDISQKDRRQPQLEISLADGKSPTGKIADREIRLKIEVAEIPGANKNEKGSGAKDVRLFRNGSLVRFWEGDVLKGQSSKITLEQNVSIVEGVNEFTAYAFNSDDIKSSDENLTVTGTENLRRKGMIYIFAIGVGKYANPEFNLSYIERDIKLFGEILRDKQSELDSGERIKIFPLLDNNATKNNILETLKALAGTSGGNVSPLPFQEPVQKVQPEDTVIVYFSGHGIALEKRFYMIPHDLGYMGKRRELFENDGLKALTGSSISDLELEEAFRLIDAKNFLLIVDACRSGQALEMEEKRQGPMNNKGLAQLAYEKGMYILTAAQSAEDAYVSAVLKQSYLTYALVEEGLKSRIADNNPTDGQLLLREWFDYARVRVPQMRQEEVKRELAEKKGLKEVTTAKPETPTDSSDQGQSPRIFYRRYPEVQPWVIARFQAAKQ